NAIAPSLVQQSGFGSSPRSRMPWHRSTGGSVIRPTRQRRNGRRERSGTGWQHGPEERPFVSPETLRSCRESNRFLHIRIGGGSLAILFVGGEAREAEHRQRNVARAFGRQEVTVVDTAETRQQTQPHPAILLKLGNLVGVDNVSNVAGYHPFVPCRPGRRHFRPIACKR